ncbi:transposase [Bradyrhizobium sp. Pear76]|nr:transposase [Bradyrhizobium oropedii]
MFIERPWRTFKHEDIYLKGWADGRRGPCRFASWLAFYNAVRAHQTLASRTRMEVWHERMAADLTVDMTLHWTTLPVATCPQPPTAGRQGVCSVILGDRSGRESN